MAAAQTGFWAASTTAVVTVVAFATAITTPPRSGPYCGSGCVTYPYVDAARYVPRDYIWMYPAIVMVVAFVVLAGCIHECALPGRRVFSRVGVCFAAMGAGMVVVDYGIQLTVMQPGLLKGETEGLSAFSQYNPHGVFIALENVGYATLSVAFVFLGIALVTERLLLLRATGWAFGVAGTLTMTVLVAYGVLYRSSLDYRFEVLSILLTWLALITGGVLLSIAFARADAGPMSNEESVPRVRVSR